MKALKEMWVALVLWAIDPALDARDAKIEEARQRYDDALEEAWQTTIEPRRAAVREQEMREHLARKEAYRLRQEQRLAARASVSTEAPHVQQPA